MYKQIHIFLYQFEQYYHKNNHFHQQHHMLMHINYLHMHYHQYLNNHQRKQSLRVEMCAEPVSGHVCNPA